MIKYALSCGNGHAFDAWFRSSDAYDKQARRLLVSCPQCGTADVDKAPMAPALLKARGSAAAHEDAAPAKPDPSPREVLQAFRQHIIANSEDVGERFADEARRIHYGESGARAIRGATSREEAVQLHDEGVEFGILPVLPDDHN